MRALYLLLGDPVAHSRSPAIHARAFALLGVDAVYAPARVEAGQLEAAFAGIRALGVAGANVTVPHKERAMQLVDRVEPRAARAGAVNCIVREREKLVGHNTDVAGILGALGAAGVDPGGKSVVVLGSGGSARAAVTAVGPAAARVTVLGRTPERARAVAALLDRAAEAGPLAGPEARRALSRADLVVNCTTLGMGSDEVPVDVRDLPEGAAVLDLVYAGSARPGETALLRAAAGRGLRAIDGLGVLVHQAVASLEVWLGWPVPGHFHAELRAAAEST